jgi:hypothetical protein
MATRKLADVAIAIFAASLQGLALVLMAPKVPSNRTGFYKPFGRRLYGRDFSVHCSPPTKQVHRLPFTPGLVMEQTLALGLSPAGGGGEMRRRLQ